jgi:hypothetical protein
MSDAMNQHKAIAMGKSVTGTSQAGLKGSPGRPSAMKAPKGVTKKSK